MAAVVTPYATGSIASVSGTTVNVSGGAVAAWVGRRIRLSTGNGRGQHRKITAVVSATQITIEFPFNVSPLAGFTDVDPVANDIFVVSTYINEIADGTTIIADPGNNSFRFVGASSFGGGVFIYAINARVDLSSSVLTCNQAAEANRVCWCFGDIDQNGKTYNGCHVLDTATGPSGFGTGSASTFDPDFHMYNGVLRCSAAGTTGPFWRMHVNNDSWSMVRLIGCQIDGNMGGRFIGSRSVLLRWSVYNMNSASGPFNPKGPFGLISGINVSKSLQAFYHYWPDSLTLEAEGINPDSTVTKLVRFANTNISGQMLTLKDNNIPVLQSMPLLYTNSSATYSNTFRLSQYLNASYLNAASSPIIDPTRVVVRDNTAATILDTTTTTGAINRQTLRYRDMTVLNNGDFTWASAGGTTFAPYAIAAIAYLYQPASLPLPLLTSQSVNLIGLSDSYVSQFIRATVDAYTTIDTLDKLYDRAKAWTCDNLAAANPSFGAQLMNGNGTELSAPTFTLVVDPNAAAVFTVSGSTITIKAATLTAGTKFKTFNVAAISLLNGATVAASYVAGGVSYAAISISGLVVGARVRVFNVTDNVEMANFAATGTTYSAIFVWPGNRTVRVQVRKKGLHDFEQDGTFLSSGLSVAVSLVTDDVYTTNNIDGSNVTWLTADYPNLQVDIDSATPVRQVQDIYAWYHAATETADGIRSFFGCIEAEDTLNYRVVTARAPLALDNRGAASVRFVGGRIYRDDGATIIAGGAIELDPGKAYTANSDTIQQLLTELHLIAGLKAGSPMTVTPTSRVAGGVSLAISGDGVTSTTVTRA